MALMETDGMALWVLEHIIYTSTDAVALAVVGLSDNRLASHADKVVQVPRYLVSVEASISP